MLQAEGLQPTNDEESINLEELEATKNALLQIIQLMRSSKLETYALDQDRYEAVLTLMKKEDMDYALDFEEFMCIYQELNAQLPRDFAEIAEQCAAPASVSSFKKEHSAKKPLLTTNSRLAMDLALMYAANNTNLSHLPPLEALINGIASNKFLMDLYGKLGVNPATPNKKLAVDMAVSLASIYFNPKAYAQISSEKVLTDFFAKVAPNYATSLKSATIILMALTANAPRTLINTYLPKAVEQYGPLVYLAAPLAALIYHKGPGAIAACYQQGKSATQAVINEDFTDAASDFCDLMYGQADEATYQKYQDVWMCKDIGSLAADVTAPLKSGLTWLGNKFMARASRKIEPDAPSTAAAQPASMSLKM